MIGKLGVPELLLILAIALLIFGPSKLADLGKGLGEGIRNFKSSVNKGENDRRRSLSGFLDPPGFPAAVLVPHPASLSFGYITPCFAACGIPAAPVIPSH